MLRVHATAETWPIAGTFTIARGAKREAHVVVATVSDCRVTGRGECVPYARYGETVESVLAEIGALETVADRHALRKAMKAGAARNAVDCALWDFEAKSSGRTAAHIAGLGRGEPLLTCYTLSLAAPGDMAQRARTGAASAAAQAEARRWCRGCPASARGARGASRRAAGCGRQRSLVHADLPMLMDAAARAGVELIEQPLPEGRDEALRSLTHCVPICADKSAYTTADLKGLAGRYDAVNIKLDKAGGLTEALDMCAGARALGLQVMVGCMVATSLAMAPALLVAQARGLGRSRWAVAARARPNARTANPRRDD